MDPSVLLVLILVVAFATYFQTVTGYGLSIIVIGVTSNFDLLPLSQAASIISLISLINCALALPPKKWASIDWAIVKIVSLSAIPASMLGVALLSFLSHQATNTLQIILGLSIVLAAAQSLFRPAPFAQISSKASFLAYGSIAGLGGGLFGMPGPPIIFLMYRQPLAMASIKLILLAIFFFISSFRELFLIATEGFQMQNYISALLSLPIIFLMTWLGHKYPPKLSPIAMRRLTFFVLVVLGALLLASA
ncbi:MAG: TSUP family transporter [Pelistega sp.]|nr:TSUP family transporter [Pelistega sp.]